MEEDPFARIKAAALKLNQSADEATRYLSAVESRLVHEGVGIEVEGHELLREPKFFTVEEDGTTVRRTTQEYLAFAKHGSQWRLVVRTINLRVLGRERAVPWSSNARTIPTDPSSKLTVWCVFSLHRSCWTCWSRSRGRSNNVRQSLTRRPLFPSSF